MTAREDLPDSPAQTHRDQVEHIRGKLVEELETLELLVRELKNGHGGEAHERERVAQISLALGYLQQSIDALKVAGRG